MEDLAANTIALQPWEILARLVCAMIVGFLIGGERETSHRPAGLRTHMLVSLGACVVMMTSQMIFAQYHAYGANPDPARLSAQVITGVGFLGAGTILREGPSIKGLTTAASLWAVACLGIAAGGGYYAVTIGGAVCIFLTLTVFERFQKRFLEAQQYRGYYRGTTKQIDQAVEAIQLAAERSNATVTELVSTRESADQEYTFSFRADFRGLHVNETRRRFFGQLAQNHYISSVEENPL